MSTSLFVALALACGSVARADFLVMDIMPGDPICLPENAEASIMIQVILSTDLYFIPDVCSGFFTARSALYLD